MLELQQQAQKMERIEQKKNTRTALTLVCLLVLGIGGIVYGLSTWV